MGEFKSPETVEAETMLAKAVGIMKADGKIDESELSVLRDIASRLGIGEGNIDAIVNDPDSAENSLPTDPFKRALFLVFMASAVWADGNADDAEKELLTEIGLALDYSTEQIEAAASAVSSAWQAKGSDLDPSLIAVQIASDFG
jgi:uncharacterized tellurite resistance protein B-like protein